LLAVPTVGLMPRLRAETGQAGSGLKAVTVPAGAYRGTTEVATVGVANLLLRRPDLRAHVAAAPPARPHRGPRHPVPRRSQPDLHRRRPPAPGAVAAYRGLHGWRGGPRGGRCRRRIYERLKGNGRLASETAARTLCTTVLQARRTPPIEVRVPSPRVAR
jgi:hypothetical protein